MIPSFDFSKDLNSSVLDHLQLSEQHFRDTSEDGIAVVVRLHSYAKVNSYCT